MRPLLTSYWLVLSFLLVFPCPPSAQVAISARPTPSLDLPALWIASDAVVFLRIRQTAGGPDSRNICRASSVRPGSVQEAHRKAGYGAHAFSSVNAGARLSGAE
jgi:hypothetical protein